MPRVPMGAVSYGGEVKVAVIGLGTIGSRLARAVSSTPGLTLVGVGVRNLNAEARRWAKLGLGVYRVLGGVQDSEGWIWRGELYDLVRSADFVLDCTPRGLGETHLGCYRNLKKRAVFQGGERRAVADVQYCNGFNFQALRNAANVRVPSCNTTGLVRVLAELDRQATLRKVRAVVVRSGTDPDKGAKGVVADLVPYRGASHHGDDVREFFPALDITTLAVTAPTNTGHIINLFVELETPVRIADLFPSHGASTGVEFSEPSVQTLRQARLMSGRGPFQDIYSALLWSGPLNDLSREMSFALAVHMEAIVIPETIAALIGMAGLAGSYEAAREIAFEALNADQTAENQS